MDSAIVILPVKYITLCRPNSIACATKLDYCLLYVAPAVGLPVRCCNKMHGNGVRDDLTAVIHIHFISRSACRVFWLFYVMIHLTFENMNKYQSG